MAGAGGVWFGESTGGHGLELGGIETWPAALHGEDEGVALRIESQADGLACGSMDDGVVQEIGDRTLGQLAKHDWEQSHLDMERQMGLMDISDQVRASPAASTCREGQ